MVPPALASFSLSSSMSASCTSSADSLPPGRNEISSASVSTSSTLPPDEETCTHCCEEPSLYQSQRIPLSDSHHSWFCPGDGGGVSATMTNGEDNSRLPVASIAVGTPTHSRSGSA